MAGPEARIRSRYVKLSQQQGWLTWVLHGSAFSGRGRPDTVTCAQGVFVGVEFKTPVGTVTEIQKHRIRQIRAAGGFAFVARSAEDAARGVAYVLHHREHPMSDIELDFGFLDPTPAAPASAAASAAEPESATLSPTGQGDALVELAEAIRELSEAAKLLIEAVEGVVQRVDPPPPVETTVRKRGKREQRPPSDPV